MTPQLADFLTRLYSEPTVSGDMPDVAERAGELFYEYLDAIGIEHCNYGGFELVGGDKLAEGQLVEFGGTRLPDPFVEEFAADLASDDYVLLKAGDLTADRPFAAFEIGLDTLDQVEAYNPASRHVQAECARHGIGYGMAMIGHAPVGPGSNDQRFFGFVYANRDPSGGREVQRRFDELRIASFALLNQIRPRLHATIDRFAYDLTIRERDVLGALAAGEQRQQIAFRFGISVPTVDMHLANLRSKLQAQTLAEAVAKGYRYGIL